MEIKQFEDKSLAHYSYAVVSKGEMAVIDPARDPKPYYDYAEENNATLTTVIETHPHADFVSSHLEIRETQGAQIYCSKRLGAEYPHLTLDEGQFIPLGKVKLKAWNTPGHSPDSITIILENERGKDVAAFTGDTLFIGDCGRPDLREEAGNIKQKREEQSRQMYHSLQKFLTLDDEVVIYPAHGSGSLCGRSLSEKPSNTMGKEKTYNWCLQSMTEDEFVAAINEQQPHIPLYFTYDVAINTAGAPPFLYSIEKVNLLEPVTDWEGAEKLEQEVVVIDTRDHQQFKDSHLENSINIQDKEPFETWLGTVIAPYTPFYLAADTNASLQALIRRVAKIGYEPFIKHAFVLDFGTKNELRLDLTDFRANPDDYTIVDVRNEGETKKKIFSDSINVPLPSLKDRIGEISLNKPVVVHCASGFRSAIGSSILSQQIGDKVQVFDLSEAVNEFK